MVAGRTLPYPTLPYLTLMTEDAPQWVVEPCAGENGMNGLIVNVDARCGRTSSSTWPNSTSFEYASASQLTAVVAARDTKVGQGATENADASHSEPTRVALIDAVQLNRDCLSKAFHGLNQGLAIISFTSIEECVGAERASFDVILYCSHGDRTFEEITLKYVKTLRDRFWEVPVVVLSDAREALQIGSIRRVLDSGARGFVPTITTEVPGTETAR